MTFIPYIKLSRYSYLILSGSQLMVCNMLEWIDHYPQRIYGSWSRTAGEKPAVHAHHACASCLPTYDGGDDSATRGPSAYGPLSVPGGDHGSARETATRLNTAEERSASSASCGVYHAYVRARPRRPRARPRFVWRAQPAGLLLTGRVQLR